MKKLKIFEINKGALKILPETFGAYIFLDTDKKLLYIGKAINIKKRVASYFSKIVQGKTKEMISKAQYISFIKVASEFEAILLEAKMINKYKPKYNVISKDDKSPLYIKITNDKYPKVLAERKTNVKNNIKYAYGPFPNARYVHMVLKILRKRFPFSTHDIQKKACLYSQMLLCNPCPNIIEKTVDSKIKNSLRKKYKSNILQIKKILDGKINVLKKELMKNMKVASSEELFEEASYLKQKLEVLDYITQPSSLIKEYLKNPNFEEDLREKEISGLYNILRDKIKIKQLRRIECFDISHISGYKPTASMVTFIDGYPEKRLYRRFKLINKKPMNDLESMKEVAERRKKNLKKWGRADLIIVDGGASQTKVFQDSLNTPSVPVIGLAKRFEALTVPVKLKRGYVYKRIIMQNSPAKSLVQRIRNEAHRFAVKYHDFLVKKDLLR